MSSMTRIVAVLAVFAIAGCTPPDGSGEINDPFEAQNRKAHAGNVSLDRNLVRPVSQGYGKALPQPVRTGVSNFSSNLGLPAAVVNNLLQARLEDALSNSARFLFNSTIGLAGLFDPAGGIGITERSTDFGETLHVWGFNEGAYIEIPVLGPSTERDAVGKVVDFALDPARALFPRDLRTADTVAGAGAVLGDRYQYSDTIDSILYESADSYAQARLLYLQNRRFELGEGEDDDYSDLYEDPYDQ